MHVELTNRCNAACPMCSRNIYGGKDRGDLIYGEWTAAESERVFSPKFRNLRNIVFCGTHGDPAVAKEGLAIVEVAKQKTSATVEFYSNGSVRSTEWWKDLGMLLRTSSPKGDSHYRQHDLCVFSIDGLGDTNHLYRRRTQFEKIMENAQAYIQAGGRARWDFLVFRHNEHQVEEAELLAKKMGFKQFRIRKTSRFAYSPDGPLKHRVLNSKGEVEYYLEPPTQEAYLNETRKEFEAIVKSEHEDRLNLTQQIACLKKTQFQRIYINALMKVWPCCFISADTLQPNTKAYKDIQTRVLDKYEGNFNSLREKEWEDILSHPWFSHDLVKSWGSPKDKLIRCQKTCSVKVNPINSQSHDKTL